MSEAEEAPPPEAYRDSEEAWWTRYGGYRDPVSNVLQFPRNALPCLVKGCDHSTHKPRPPRQP